MRLAEMQSTITFRKTDGSTVTGTIIEVKVADRRYRVDWHDDYRTTELCADSNAIVSISSYDPQRGE